MDTPAGILSRQNTLNLQSAKQKLALTKVIGRISYFINQSLMAHADSDLVKTCLKFWTRCMNIWPESEMLDLWDIIQFQPHFHLSNLAKHIVTGNHFPIFSFCFCHAFLNLGTSSWNKVNLVLRKSHGQNGLTALLSTVICE